MHHHHHPKVSLSMSTTSGDSFQNRVGTAASQKRLLHSDSSVSYQVGGALMAPLPPSSIGSPNYCREESIKEMMARSMALFNEDLEHHGGDDDDFETTTSRSLVHGFILVSIMLSSLVAFITGKVHRCSSLSDLSNYEHCSRYFSLYSLLTIVSCLVTFLIYFLHLIAQCDLLCLTRRKYQVEIATLTIVASLLLLTSLLYTVHTDILSDRLTLTSLVLSSLSVLLYVLRIIILLCEMISQRRRRTRRASGSQQKKVHTASLRNLAMNARRSISKEQSGDCEAGVGRGVLPVTKVITYVRNAPRKVTLSTSLSEDLDDDVFIQ